jgi:hypothetical protein
MAVHIKPCHGCSFRDGCDLVSGFRSSVRSVPGLRSATFNCPRLETELRPGRRVLVCVVVGIDEDSFDSIYDTVKATITSHKDGRVALTIDAGQLDDYVQSESVGNKQLLRFRKAKHMRIIEQFLDEPDAKISDCGNIIINGRCDMSVDAGDCCMEMADGLAAFFAHHHTAG